MKLWSVPDEERDAPASGQPTVPPDLQALAREAKEQFEQGNYLEAEKTYRKILAQSPDNLYTATAKGWTEAAAKELETVRKLDPDLISPRPGDEGLRDFLTPLEKERLGTVSGT